jgi:hypothetical protein
MTPRICPECAAGKHINCTGEAWDNEADAPTECECVLHVWLDPDDVGGLA